MSLLVLLFRRRFVPTPHHCYSFGAGTLIIRTTTAHSLHAHSGLAMATNDSSLGIPLPAVLPPNHNAGHAVLILVWVLFGVSTALVAARAYSKIAILKRFATDDVLMSLSWVMRRESGVCLVDMQANTLARLPHWSTPLPFNLRIITGLAGTTNTSPFRHRSCC